MIIKKAPSMNLFCFSTEATLMELGKYVRVKAHETYIEAVKNNLEITGPIYWIYYGMDGNPETRFKLDIGVPVQHVKPTSDGFNCKTIGEMELATCIHEGSWDKFPQSYSSLIGELMKSGRMMNGIAREVYINIDFENPKNNITEIQLGLKSLE
ncbi:MAG: AraC family transcriptional regulator [Bacteroidales bacterium]|nr:MAG: AraC family transcriptional regulator [Bacteroidales bacterium]